MSLQAENSIGGRYRPIRRLGVGGSAAVHLAEDERLGRQVAVKRLHGESGEEMVRRFGREARVGASLNHPNIVAVYDTLVDDEGVAIVMEYVEGETLGAALERGPLALERGLEILTALAAALDHAHGGGVVHRDVKPANVLLGTDGSVKLADLGIASATEATRITRVGTVLGTPQYMSPEQLAGEPTGPRSDVYSFGAVAFEVLGGRSARTSRLPIELANELAREPVPDLRDARPGAPSG
ncbi:MAG: serine/threonine protein kinase, partial [Thermoleophilaceae bacterium]|nr:serine/threonine protein kinase [Thermoleophilaceae bacterium]